MINGVDWVAVDWGTSNLRVWGLASDGSMVFEQNSPKGMGRLARENYPIVLAELLADISPRTDAMDILICGMAGARQGWKEAPYLEAPIDLHMLMQGAVQPAMPGGRFTPYLLPGICQKADRDNVMRGEETQLLGLAATKPGFAGMVCLPGTHSKWVQMSGYRIDSFTTAMTGELFDLLSSQSVLRHSLIGATDSPARGEGFIAGAETGLAAPEKLLNTLFQVRAGSLLSNRQPDWCAGFLSGLLIGTEIGANRHLIGSGTIPLVGAPVLCGLYADILTMIGSKGERQDASALVLAGLKVARASLHPTRASHD